MKDIIFITKGDVYMKNQENTNTNKDKKSFKEVVYDNRGTIIAISGTVVAATLGVIVAKNYKGLAKCFKKTNAKSDLGLMVGNELWEKLTVTANIINNSGIIDQARATVIRKRDTLVGKLNCLTNMKQTSDNIKNKILQIKAGIEAYDKMLDQYDELEYLYKCRTAGETLLED